MAPSVEELTGRAAKAEAEIEELVAELEKMKRGRWVRAGVQKLLLHKYVK